MNSIHRLVLWVLGKPIESIIRPFMEKIAMSIAELEPRLQAIADNLAEASVEITDELQKLRDQLENNGQLSEGARNLLERIEAKAKSLADVVPNAGEPTEPTEPGEPGENGEGEQG